MTVGELLHRISARELREWQAFERIYGPVGPARDDHLAALIAAQVASTFANKAANVADFMPPWDVRETGDEEVDDGDDS